MSAKDVAENVLLAVGVLIQLLCCVGVLVAPDTYPRLHYLAPASSVGIILVAAAVIIQFPLSQSCAKAVLVAGFLLLSSPVLSHATARAAKLRSEGRLDEGNNRDGGS